MVSNQLVKYAESRKRSDPSCTCARTKGGAQRFVVGSDDVNSQININCPVGFDGGLVLMVATRPGGFLWQATFGKGGDTHLSYYGQQMRGRGCSIVFVGHALKGIVTIKPPGREST